MSSTAVFRHLQNRKRNRNLGIADRGRQSNSIDLYVGNIPKQFNYEAMVNVIYTTYEYYKEEGKEVYELPELQPGDVIRIADLKMSNEQYWDQHKKSLHNKTSSEDSESENEYNNKNSSTDYDLSDDQKNQTRNTNKNYNQERKSPSKTMYCFMGLKTREIANAFRYCLNGLRIYDSHQLVCQISRHHMENTIDEDAVQVEKNFGDVNFDAVNLLDNDKDAASSMWGGDSSDVVEDIEIK